LNSFGEIIPHAHCSVDEKKLKYIPCVPHKNNCQKKIGSQDMKQTYFSIIIVMNVCVLTSASMIVYLFFINCGLCNPVQMSKMSHRIFWIKVILHQFWMKNIFPGKFNLRICRFLVVGNIFRLETCMNSLVKVPPYSKLNFPGKMFFIQNWCNITLIQNIRWLIFLRKTPGLGCTNLN
jgi:hypothetical protein